MILSVFGCWGSVNKRNLVPVKVEKHWRRKFSVSRTSIPEGESGRMSEVVEEREGVGWRGCRRVVIAWTLFITC